MVVIPYTTATAPLQRRPSSVREVILSAPHRELGAVAHRAGARAHRASTAASTRAPTPRSGRSDFWDMLKVLFGMLFAIQLFMAVAGTLTLLVGAVGVMNIMLVVVDERTAEIGLRKALGARGRDIFVQFLTEAVVVALTASIAGIAAGSLAYARSRGAFERAGIAVSARPDPSRPPSSAVRSWSSRSSPASRPPSAPRACPPAEALRSY